jgi:histidinol phosphatase-like PHP family hydrolase
MIDLHMHTTASNGRRAPEDLVRHAFDKGIHTMSVTDHDTMAGVARARAAQAAAEYGMTAQRPSARDGGASVPPWPGGKIARAVGSIGPEI